MPKLTLKFENHAEAAAVKETVERLRSAGHVALLAGGCVRDLLIDRTPNDFDVATSATPDEVEKLFTKSIAVGKQFGVIVLPFEGFQIEVATFREDLEYRDGRRPEGVAFSTAEADAGRRDFTINALFYDLQTEQVIDFVRGRQDLNDRLIRTVGDPERRFAEDKLRLLRAVRFAAQLDFTIAAETLLAIKKFAAQINVVSRERIRDELLKLVSSKGRVRGFTLLNETGLLTAILPTYRDLDPVLWLSPLSSAKENLCVTAGLAVFFAPAFDKLGEDIFRSEIIKGLKLDNKLADALLYILKAKSILANPGAIREGEVALLLAKPNAAAALEFAGACGYNMSALDEIRRRCLNADGRLPTPFLSGGDALASGLSRGPRLGQVLHEGLLRQVEGALRTREDALVWLNEQTRTV